MDFGIVAELCHAPMVRDVDSAVGTPAFMAPEQARGAQPTAAADWYALGVLLYLALTGQLPYRGSEAQILQDKQQHAALPPSVFVRDVPDDLEQLCMDLLCRNPAARPMGSDVLKRLGIDPVGLPAAIFPGQNTLFVGRSSERATLREAYQQVQTGAALCVLVEGVSGIGKTSLVDRFLRDVRDASREPATPDPPLILSGRCHQREAVPFRAFDGVIDGLSDFLASLSRPRRRGLLPPDLALLARRFPVLARLPECRQTDSLDSEPLVQRKRAFAALRALLCAVSAQQPVILRIEDLQWADAASLDLLFELFSPSAPSRVLLIASCLSDASQSQAALHELVAELSARVPITRLHLGVLSEPEQHELIRLFEGTSTHAQHPMWKESGGHPMLLAELARYVAETPELPADPGTMRLETVLSRRICFLPAAARRLLEVIAVASAALPLRVLGRVGALSAEERERAATALHVAQLAKSSAQGSGEPWIHISHEQVRNAMLAQLSADQQCQRNLALAEHLQAWGQASPALLAQHFGAGGRPETAAYFLLQAAAQSADQLALEHAAGLYRSALDLLAALPSDAKTDALRCQAWLGLAKGRRLISADDAETWTCLDRAQALAAASEQLESLSTICYLRGSLLFPRGDVAGCMQQHGLAQAYARRAASPQAEARALSGLGDASLLQGQIQRAHEHYHQCISLCQQHQLLDIEAVNLPMRGMTRYFRNELHEGLLDCTTALSRSTQLRSHRSELIACSGAVVWILLDLEQIDEAQQHVSRALRLSRRLENQRFEAHALANQARICAARGQLVIAQELALAALRRCQGQGAALTAPLSLGLLATLAVSAVQGQPALAEGTGMLDSGMRNPACLLFLRDAIRACLRWGDVVQARSYAERLRQCTLDQHLAWSQRLYRHVQDTWQPRQRVA